MKQNVPRYSPRKPAPKADRPAFSWLTPKRVRALKVILGLSFILSLTVQLYVFGFTDGFFLRWLSSLLFFFLFIAVTVLGIIPLVNYVFKRWLRF